MGNLLPCDTDVNVNHMPAQAMAEVCTWSNRHGKKRDSRTNAAAASYSVLPIPSCMMPAKDDSLDPQPELSRLRCWGSQGKNKRPRFLLSLREVTQDLQLRGRLHDEGVERRAKVWQWRLPVENFFP